MHYSTRSFVRASCRICYVFSRVLSYFFIVFFVAADDGRSVEKSTTRASNMHLSFSVNAKSHLGDFA